MNAPSSSGSSGGTVAAPEGSSGHIHMRRRFEVYLALTIASLISISCVAVSAPRSEVKIAVVTCASLSFAVTLILGVGLFSRSLRYSLTTSLLTEEPDNNHHNSRWKIRRKATVEKIAVLLVFVLECIVSGMVLYPRFDTNRMAVAGNEIWNPNLFYITWFSLYGSAYLVEVAIIYAVESSWFMCLFSSTCTATALLIIHSGPACRGKYLSVTPYCSSALAAGSVHVVCAVVLLVCGACFGVLSVNRRGRLRKYLMSIGATMLLIVQCAVVAVVTAPSGPGHETGNAFITSWMSLVMCLSLWKTSIESWFIPEPRETLSSFKGYLRKKSSTSTADEGYSDDDHGNSCDPLSSEVRTDIPKEVQAGDDNYWRNLRGPDPEDDTSFNNSRRRAQGSKVLKEADAILSTVADIIRREDPGGISFNSNANPDRSRKKIQVRAMEPPSREASRPDPINNDSVKVDRERRSRPLAPIPTNSDTITSSARKDQGRKSELHRSHSSQNPTVPSSASLMRGSKNKRVTRRNSPPTRLPTIRHAITSSTSMGYQVRKSTGRRSSISRSSVPSRVSSMSVPSINGELRQVSTITSQTTTVPSRASARGGHLSIGETTLSSPLLTESSSRSKYDRGIKPSARSRPPPPPRSTQHQMKGEASSKHSEKKTNRVEERIKPKENESPTPPPDENSPDSDMYPVPFDILLKDDQSSTTEITIHVPDSQYDTHTSARVDRKVLSVAVSAALHAASVSAAHEKMAHSTVGETDFAYIPIRQSARPGQSHLQTTHHQIEGQSESLQSRNMRNDNVTSPSIRAFTRRSTLDQAEKLMTYSDLEDSKLNIQGGSESCRHTDPATGLVGILKHDHSGSHRKTPSQSSTSKWSEQSSTPGNKTPKLNHNESDMLLRILSERLQGGPTGISTSIHGLGSNHGSLSRRKSSTVEHLSQTLESCGNPTRSPMHSRYSEDDDDDAQTVHVEFNC